MSSSSISGMSFFFMGPRFFSVSHHISPNISSFMSLSPIPSRSLLIVDGTHMSLAGVGSIITFCFFFPNVYYIYNLTLNLVSPFFFFTLNLFFSFACYLQDLQS